VISDFPAPRVNHQVPGCRIMNITMCLYKCIYTLSETIRPFEKSELDSFSVNEEANKAIIIISAKSTILRSLSIRLVSLEC
jgi:hypothetical protein